jgi:hypothetical protein
LNNRVFQASIFHSDRTDQRLRPASQSMGDVSGSYDGAAKAHAGKTQRNQKRRSKLPYP